MRTIDAEERRRRGRDHPEAMQEGRGAAERANRKRGRRPSEARGKRIIILPAGRDGQHPLIRSDGGGYANGEMQL